MKRYSNSIVINMPAAELAQLYTRKEDYRKWRPDLSEFDTFEGEHPKLGSKARVVFKMGRHDTVKAVEMVTVNDLPQKYQFQHDSEGITTTHTVYFDEIAVNKTNFQMDTEYDTDGLMRIYSFFNPNHFEKQTEEHMESFKKYAENQR